MKTESKISIPNLNYAINQWINKINHHLSDPLSERECNPLLILLESKKYKSHN